PPRDPAGRPRPVALPPGVRHLPARGPADVDARAARRRRGLVTAPTTLAEIAETAARRAGAVLLAHAGATLEVETKSSATDPVTEADRASEQALVEFLTRHRPDDGLLGEEGADTPSRSGLRWVVDPLDGTVNFLYGLPAWSVSVAVEEARD